MIRKDDWAKFAYKRFDEGPPIQATKALLTRLEDILPFSRATAVLDIAAGPGTVFDVLFNSGIEVNPDAPLTAQDISPTMISHIKASQGTDKLWANVRTEICDATDLSSISDRSQSHVMSQMGIFLVDDSDKALREARRVLAPGGVFAMTSVAQASWMQDVLAQLTVLHPALHMPVLAKKWQSKDTFSEELQRAGFTDVKVYEIPIYIPYEDEAEVVQRLWDVSLFMTPLTKDLTEEEKRTAKARMVKFVKANFQGQLPGLALLGVGR